MPELIAAGRRTGRAAMTGASPNAHNFHSRIDIARENFRRLEENEAQAPGAPPELRPACHRQHLQNSMLTGGTCRAAE